VGHDEAETQRSIGRELLLEMVAAAIPGRERLEIRHIGCFGASEDGDGGRRLDDGAGEVGVERRAPVIVARLEVEHVELTQRDLEGLAGMPPGDHTILAIGHDVGGELHRDSCVGLRPHDREKGAQVEVHVRIRVRRRIGDRLRPESTV